MKKDIPVALVIENPILLLGFQEVIDSLDGFNVAFTCNSVAEYLSGICHNNIEHNICLLDISLHHADTPEIMDRFLLKSPSLKILALSPTKHIFCAKKALAYGASGLLAINSPKEEVHRALVSLRFTDQYFGDHLHIKNRSAIRKTVNSTAIENGLLTLLCTELSYEEIADQMNLSPQMVGECTQILFDKFGVASRVGLAVHAWEMGLLGD